jgi:hypothetical protein
VAIPATVTRIESYAFNNCTNLTGVHFKGNAPSLSTREVFTGADNSTIYYLPGTTGWDKEFGGRPTAPEIQEMVATSRLKGVDWRFTFKQPADDWIQPGFVDSAWNQGPGGFGTKDTQGAVARTEWTTADIWLRREFDWAADKAVNPVFFVHHDDDIEIYLNGVLAGKAGGSILGYERMAMTPEGLAALKPGKNVLAVHCHQTFGPQYVDVGIITETPVSK